MENTCHCFQHYLLLAAVVVAFGVLVVLPLWHCRYFLPAFVAMIVLACGVVQNMFAVEVLVDIGHTYYLVVERVYLNGRNMSLVSLRQVSLSLNFQHHQQQQALEL